MTEQKKPWQHDYGVCGDCCVDGYCKECGCTPEEVFACHCPDKWREELDAAKLRIAELEKDTEDDDPSNVLCRAGYLHGMATKTDNDDDRDFLLQASRSLKAFAAMLGEKP